MKILEKGLVGKEDVNKSNDNRIVIRIIYDSNANEHYMYQGKLISKKEAINIMYQD